MRLFHLPLFIASFGLISAAAGSPPEILHLRDFTDTKEGVPAEGWTEEADNIIHLKGNGGDLISKLEYTNFVLEWDWKLTEKANNGIKYWVTKVGGKQWLGIEYQMIDDLRNEDGLKGGSHATAALYDIKPPIADKGLKPVGEWNSSKVVVQNGNIEHWLNGKLVAEADTKGDAWKQLIAASKFKNKEGFAPGNGKIMLTNHHDETWFRNIRIEAK